MSDTAVCDDFTEEELDTMETELEKLANGNDPDTWVNDELAALEEEFGVESESEPAASPTQKLIQTIITARQLVKDLRTSGDSESAELHSIKQSLAAVESSSEEIRTALQRLDTLLNDLQDRVATLEKR